MSQLTPEVIAAIDSRMNEIRTDYEKRLEQDRALTGSMTKWVSSAVAIGFSVLAYFGFKGFDDIVERAIEKKYPREKWESMVENVSDYSLVQTLSRDQRARRGYSEREVEAFHRLLQARSTRVHLFQDVVALLKDKRRLPDAEQTLQLMTDILRGRDKFEWVRHYPPKQEALVAFLTDHKYLPASEAVLPLLHSAKKDIQLAAVRYVRDCRIDLAKASLAQLVKVDNDHEVRNAAAMALISMGGSSPEAEAWLALLTTHPLSSVDEAALVLRGVTAAAESTVGELSTPAASAPPRGFVRASVVRGRREAPGNLAVQTTLDVLRAVLLNNYILTVAMDDNTRLVYVTQDAKTYSDENLSPILVSNPLVDALLRRELQRGTNLADLRQLVRGLSGLVTHREVLDIRQEVIFVLGNGEIEFADGQKHSQALTERLADKLSRDELIARKWNMRRWRLRVNETGELIAETTSGSSPRFSGRLRSIKLGDQSAFRIVDVASDLPLEQAGARSARLQ